jgi:pimeloyl-ACP methyl ester carboxylesterase
MHMSTVRSADGTTIGYEKAGAGPPLILVDGALCRRSFGPMPKLAALLAADFTVYTYDRRGRGESGDTAPYSVEREVEDLDALIIEAGGSVFVHGTSSGAALALEAAKRTAAIEKLALYEAPFIIDDTRSPIPDGYLERLTGSVAADRSGDAVKQFMKFVGTPAIFVAIMPFTPVWSKLKAVAHTLPYDITILADHQRGTPLGAEEWKTIEAPALVMDGGKSPAWIRNAARSLADVMPAARYQTLDGQTHMVKPQAIAPVITEFFSH